MPNWTKCILLVWPSHPCRAAHGVARLQGSPSWIICSVPLVFGGASTGAVLTYRWHSIEAVFIAACGVSCTGRAYELLVTPSEHYNAPDRYTRAAAAACIRHNQWLEARLLRCPSQCTWIRLRSGRDAGAGNDLSAHALCTSCWRQFSRLGHLRLCRLAAKKGPNVLF
jgi:hypothetical protein